MSDQDVEVSTVEDPRTRDPARWIDPLREITRGTVAILLFCLLAGEVGCAFVAIKHIASTTVQKEEKIENAKLIMDLLNIVMPPTVALFGAATGFYYGTRVGRS